MSDNAPATSTTAGVAKRLADLTGSPESVPALVDALLEAARNAGASDVHLVPTADGLDMAWRIHGVLEPVMRFDESVKSNIVARLKVLAELLTYRADVPQEGRINTTDADCEIRVSTFPTLFGEKAVIRIAVGSGAYRRLDALNFDPVIVETLQQSLHETGGVLLITGPAGSGKTTTAYACLREIIESHPVRRSVVSLEDPIESIVNGAAQSQINPSAGFDYETGLKSLLRQDPEVILVGEIRDPATAAIVFQAALTGHLVITTFHAGSAAESVARLFDMGIEPYQLRSALRCVINQRLVRVLCECGVEGESDDDRLGLVVSQYRIAAGCDQCDGTGYRHRQPLVEMLNLNARNASEVVSTASSSEIERQAINAGMTTRWQQSCALVEAGITSPEEIRRVLGFREAGS